MRGNEPAEAQNKPDVWETFLVSLRYREGRIIQVSGNNPIFLDKSEYVWFVYNGKVDVFTARTENDALVGARNHLFRVTDRHVLFGMNLLDKPISVMMVGEPGTQLLRVSLSSLVELANDAEFAQLVALALDDWVMLLSSVIP